MTTSVQLETPQLQNRSQQYRCACKSPWTKVKKIITIVYLKNKNKASADMIKQEET